MFSEGIIAADDIPGSLRAALGQKALDELKYRIHDRLVQQLDLAEVRQLPEQNRRGELRLVVTHMLAAEEPRLDPEVRETVVTEVLDELVGLGPLEKLLREPGGCDILVNGPHDV